LRLYAVTERGWKTDGSQEESEEEGEEESEEEVALIRIPSWGRRRGQEGPRRDYREYLSRTPAKDNIDTLSREERGTITMAAKKKAPAKKAKKTSKKK